MSKNKRFNRYPTDLTTLTPTKRSRPNQNSYFSTSYHSPFSMSVVCPSNQVPPYSLRSVVTFDGRGTIGVIKNYSFSIIYKVFVVGSLIFCKGRSDLILWPCRKPFWRKFISPIVFLYNKCVLNSITLVVVIFEIFEVRRIRLGISLGIIMLSFPTYWFFIYLCNFILKFCVSLLVFLFLLIPYLLLFFCFYLMFV